MAQSLQITIKEDLTRKSDREKLDAVLIQARAFVSRMEANEHQTRVNPGTMAYIIKVLLHNAYDAIFTSGNTPKIVVNSIKKNGIVTIKVRDNGCGYGRTGRKLFGGAGTGVSTVREEINSFDGTLNYKENSFGGTTAIVKIPASF